MATDWIVCGAKCVDKRGKQYKIITRAKDVQTGDFMVVYSQEFGEKETLCCPQDAFLVSFTSCEAEEEIIPIASRQKPASREERMMMFFDTDDYETKERILKELHILGELTDSIIDNFAATLDVVIEEGDLETRFDQLRICVATRARYETSRLRKQA